MDHREHARLAAVIARRRKQLARLELEVTRVREQLANDEKELERLLRNQQGARGAPGGSPEARLSSVVDEMTCNKAARALHKCNKQSDKHVCSEAGRYLKRCADAKRRAR